MDVTPIDPDSEEDIENMEKEIRSIQVPGLEWGASELIEIAYGVKKMQIRAMVDEKVVSRDSLKIKIEELDELVMSVSIVPGNRSLQTKAKPPVAAAAAAEAQKVPSELVEPLVTFLSR